MILVRIDLLDTGPSFHPLHPFAYTREFVIKVFTGEFRGPTPRGDKRKIGIGALVADEPLAISENRVKNAADAADLITIPGDGAVNLLRVYLDEPRGLSIVRCLARDLEENPLPDVISLGGGGVRQVFLSVVLLNQILRNGTRFPENDAGVGIFNDG